LVGGGACPCQNVCVLTLREAELVLEQGGERWESGGAGALCRSGARDHPSGARCDFVFLGSVLLSHRAGSGRRCRRRCRQGTPRRDARVVCDGGGGGRRRPPRRPLPPRHAAPRGRRRGRPLVGRLASRVPAAAGDSAVADRARRLGCVCPLSPSPAVAERGAGSVGGGGDVGECAHAHHVPAA